jgi:zinc metalloprotease ZmpB
VPRWILLLLIAGLSAGVVAEAGAQAREDAHDRPARAGYEAVHLDREVRDASSGVVRARYRIDERRDTESGEENARRHLARHRADYGIANVGSELRLVRSTERASSTHLTFEQLVDGVPVLGGNVHVNLDASGWPTMVISGFEPGLREARFPPIRLNAARALEAAEQQAGYPLTIVVAPRLVIFPGDRPARAYHLIARPPDDHTEWSFVVDASTGDVLEWISTASHAHRTKRGIAPAEVAETRETGLSASAVETVDGVGYVFDPDPLTTAGVEYGPPYVNANDADIPELNVQRVERPLREITRFDDGRYRLQGPYVTIVGSDVIGASYTPPAPLLPEFRYTRANDFFEAVNAYYHIDESQRHAQALDIDVRQFPVQVNPHGLGALDDSQFLPASNAIMFGTGGIDDAEDAEVVWHEYAHAMLEDAAPGLLGTLEGRALHEGWADYWAVSYTRDLIESGAVPLRDWRKFATWDGNETWQGRYLNHTGVYPQDAPCARGGACNIYQDGLLWATTLMEIWTELGRETTDQLNLASHFYLSPPTTMRDAAEALIQADLDLNDGAHSIVLSDILSRRGFVDLAAPPPTVSHTAPPTTEQIGGNVDLVAVVESYGLDVEVTLVYRFSGGADQTLPMVASESGHFESEVSLPNTPGTLAYYVEVRDELGRTVRSPSGAPASRYHVEFGPDVDPPVIRHDPPAIVNLLQWPIQISAVITDRLGVAEARVDYEIDGLSGSFGLSAADSVYTGTFPDADVIAGTVIQYRIIAVDESQAANLGVAPSDGAFTMVVTDGSVVRSFDFDSETYQGITSTGVWTRGEPRYGVLFAHEGNNVWATRPTGRYPSSAGSSTLQLPAMDLSSIDNALLVFWHWFDTEHNGHAIGPRRGSNARAYDGGNVKISTDGGVTWTLADPLDGYNATIVGGYGNPLGGQPGFGGHSLSWRRAIIPLPAERDVRVRFDFGTDEGNAEQSVGYAGWYIDGLSIRLDVPSSTEPPQIQSVPLAALRTGHIGPLPILEVVATDDLGIAAVRLPYSIRLRNGSIAAADTAFLAMHPADRTRFIGRIAPGISLEPGMSVSYHVEALDVSGNVAEDRREFRIDIAYEEQRSVLHSVRTTGAWQLSGARWTTSGESDAGVSSSLLVAPLDLPSNTESLQLALRHTYAFQEGTGGNLRISTDDGQRWELLSPIGGYAGVIGGDHVMAADSGFVGTNQAVHTRAFDLAPFAGEQVRLRFDTAGEGAQWTIEQVNLRILADSEDIETPRRYTLLAPYPNPATSATTLGYSLESQQTVLLEVVDMLGRRIDVLVWAVQPEGVYTLTYDMTRLAAGSYILSLTTDQGRLTRRLVRLR